MFASRFFRRVVIVGLTAGIILCSRITQPAPDKIHAAPVFASFTVNSLLDTPDINPGDGVCATGAAVCTLRAAIQEANALAGADVITFSVVGTITIATVLPAITQQVTITGTTTGVAPFQPQVAIDANNPAMGLWFSSTASSTSSNSSVSGLAIRNADLHPGMAVRIEPGAGGLAVSNVRVSGCWFGMNDAGTAAGRPIKTYRHRNQ